MLRSNSSMKKFFPLLFLTGMPVSAFDVPKSFFEIAKLEEARVEAAEKPKTIGFLITDPKMQPS